MNKPARAYCFTLNNPDGLLDFTDMPDYVRCCIYQEEVGANGTPHFQGYIELKAPRRITSLQRIPGLDGAHFEIRRGTRAEAIAYCQKKDDTYIDGPYTFGDLEAGGQGSRNDYAGLKKAIDKGATDKALWDEYPDLYLRFSSVIPKIRMLTTPQRNFKTKVYVLWGPPNTGKTTWCLNHSSGKEGPLYFKQRSNWWDGYDGVMNVILDDFYAWIKYDELLRLCDMFPCQVEIKGSHVAFAPRRIYITSNKHPQEWYNARCLFSSFARRVTKWMSFHSLGQFQSFNWDMVASFLNPQ